MPLSRYRIRNVYSFADPELHTAPDNNDPEALLEAVAMAGLVGVLRQLGDLAEFAAEIFHELHEEVMATAARGHGLMARVQQLEAEFPSIEKEFLSQTSHSLFFHNTGVDWHPNLHIDQNLITQRDLPRFVMETYEACQGPPRLFLLDKYDVAGAGACLKRYTDPSFFKLDLTYSGMMNPKAQREKKIRKAKKKGSRWKNGGTPEVLPTSHAKLHQLFLEENIENHINDPACRVKLKRQLNGFPFDSKTGKSYMEKFLKTPTSDHNVVHEISSNSSPLKLPPNTTGESGIEILGIGALSPEKETPQRKKSPHSSPVVEETRRKPSMDESIQEIDYGKVIKPNPISEGETLLSKFYEEVDEKEIIIHGERKIEGSADGYQSDDIASDAENYTDAIITMDSEMETNIEAKNDLCFLITANREVDSDTNKEQQDFQIHFSESQSIGNPTATEVGNKSSRKGISCFSCSDSLSINPSDGEVSAEVLPSTEIVSAEIVNMLSDQCSVNGESLPTQPLEYMPEFGEPSSSSYVTDSSAPTLLPLEPVNGSREVASVGPELDEISSYCNERNNGHINPEESRRYVGDNLPCTPNRFDVPSQTGDDFLPELSAENHPVEESDDGDACFLSHASLHPSTILELAPAKESNGNLLHDVLQAEYAEDECTKILMDSQIVAPHSIASNTEEQLLYSALPVLETSDVKPYGIVPEVDDVPPLSVETLISSTAVEDIQTSSFLKQQFLEITENVLSLDPDSEKFGCSYFTEENLYGASSTVDGEELCGLYSDVDMVGKIAADLPSDFHNSPDLPRVPEVREHIDDVVTETLHPEPMTVATAVPGTQCDDNEDDGKSLSTRPTKVQEESIYIILQDLRKSGLEIDEMCSPKHIPESGTEKEVDQQTVAASDLDPVISNAVSYDDSKSELLNNVPDFSMAAISRNSLHIFDAATVPLLSDQNDQDSESKSLQQIDVIENAEDVVSSPSLYIAVLTPPDQKVELQDAQFDVVSGDTGKESSEPFNNVESVQSLNHLDQEAHTDASSKLCVAHLPSQPSVAERLPQLDASEQAPDTSSSILPSFDLLPEASENNLDEMPPLPPLPPVQWRLGKVQHASLVPERDLLQYNMGLFPRIMSSTAGEKVQLGHLAKGENTQPSNQFLPLPAVKNKNSQHDHENLAGYMVHSTPLSMQLPTMVNHGNSEDDYPTSGRTQSVNPFLLLPTIFDKRSRRFPPEDGAAQSPSNPFSPVANVKDTVSAYSTSQEKLIQPLHQSAPQTSLEDESLRGISVFSEGKVGNPPDITSPPLMQDDQPQHVFSERETAWSSSSSVLLAPFEDGKPDGNRQKKLPLPRNPLIDAVVAHDRSKLRKVTVQVRPQIGQKLDERDSLMVQLRKVTERARPQIGQKLDERDSLLQQIRAKSFNLKPASATKSSIQGPKTNLKVAAILEKANSIRQALAGSDEDDDVDGWSDS